MTPLFQYQHSVRLHETDGAGILFYGQVFTLAHNAHEALLERHGLPLNQLLRDHPFTMVVAHTEADYIEPIRLSETLTLSLHAANIGETSFTLRADINGEEQQPKAVVTTVYVTIDKHHQRSIPLPAPISQLLHGSA